MIDVGCNFVSSLTRVINPVKSLIVFIGSLKVIVFLNDSVLPLSIAYSRLETTLLATVLSAILIPSLSLLKYIPGILKSPFVNSVITLGW